jgi:thiosulfate dehydrogenase
MGAARSIGRRRILTIGAVACAALAGCTLQEAGRTDTTATAAQRTATRGYNAETWQPPVVDSTPDDPLEASIYRGLALITHTRDSLPAYAGGSLVCTSCHLDEGRRPNAAPLMGVMARFPKFIDRAGAVVPIEDRINYCFTRSLSGSRLPSDSREMQVIVAYLAYISKGVPTGEHVRGEGFATMPKLFGDAGRGHKLFTDNCARCHGNDGAGIGPAPALWGAKSFSIGASMARVERAASFIRHNMPFDKPGSLTDQQSYDIAAYVTSMPRPDQPGKETDWPSGEGVPSDVPYDTKGHKALHPPKLLPRANPANAIVGNPPSVIHK